ncbi:hypothetical protein ACFWBC_26280 [Streptomyces sp. NPDC059985]|uniref:hypothetical protein n=1 Tax=Streptomyces sp. NPDC059985 TaxID=3347025 RepID=UPI00368C0CE5
MARSELTAAETAVWDQLVAELSGTGGRVSRTRRGARRRRLAMIVAMTAAAFVMLVAGVIAGAEALAWSGVIVWVNAVLIVSHVQGHGPKLPVRR